MIDYSKIPPHMQGGAKRYIENGIAPGSFLTAVICNDLMGAFGKADEVNRAAMWEWCNFIYNEAPATCWGSPDKMDSWIARGGALGREDAA